MGAFESIKGVLKKSPGFYKFLCSCKDGLLAVYGAIRRFFKRVQHWLKYAFCRSYRFQQQYLSVFEERRFAPDVTLDEKKKLLRHIFYSNLGYMPDFEKPKTINDKLYWLILHYHSKLLTQCADKVDARNIMREWLGEDYLIPAIGAYDSVDAIPWDELPEKFVLKVNWGSGQNIICKNKAELDIEDAKEKLRKWMLPENCLYYQRFEPQYEGLKPMVLCEKYIEQMDGLLYDYKIHCFHGEPKFIQLNDRWGTHTGCIYDMDWKKTDLHTAFTLDERDYDKPECLDDMLRVARIIAKNFPYCRVDLYQIDHRVYFGELTFTSSAGNLHMPEKDALEWGALLDLTKIPAENLR